MNDEWMAKCEVMLTKYPPLNDFVVQWGPHCGASPQVFLGQICRMVMDCWVIAAEKLKADALKNIVSKSPKLERFEEFQATGLDLLNAVAFNLEEDTLMAFRFLYYVKAYTVIDDSRYDQAERAFMTKPGVDDSPLMSPGSDLDEDYPPHIKALAVYLMCVNETRRQADAERLGAIKEKL